MKTKLNKSMKQLLAATALTMSMWSSGLLHAAAPQNFYGGYTSGNTGLGDKSKPVSSRSYFTTKVEPTADGAKLIVEIWHGKLNSSVSLHLQAAVNDGSGNFEAIPFMNLDTKVADNPKEYYSRREFNLTYKELNDHFGKLLPAGAKHLEIGHGTPLFVYAEFHDYGHQWGSVGRGGLFFMPDDPKSAGKLSSSTVQARRPTEIEVAYPITETMVMKYNDPKTKAGLKQGGEVGSHLEAEGKYQIPLEETEAAKKRLFDLANNPSEAARILGPDWTITANLRYMLKDPKTGQLILDAQGLPTPDPMVDTYYDNDNYDAAKKDINIRYRKTEQNGIGKWGLKPGMGNLEETGIVRRIEYALDATDDKPETVRAFSDSLDPLNPFRVIRESIPGATPSDFLKPSVKVIDTRFKFVLKHKTGVSMEVSLDQVRAESMRGNVAPARYTQIEMDVEHAATSAAAGSGSNAVNGFTGLSSVISSSQTTFMSKLTKDAILDGRPVLHTVADLDPSSPVQMKNKADFDLAAKAITSLRDHVVGKNWVPGAQKGSLAVSALGLISDKDSSVSVKRMIADHKKLGSVGTLTETVGASIAGNCATAFGK